MLFRLNGFLLSLSAVAFLASTTSGASTITKKIDGSDKKNKGEVLDNPTLRAESGALSSWSFYSSFTYKGGSLADPKSAERPNIVSASEKPNLQSISGDFGVKYRLTKEDNISLRMGAYMAAPFHSSFTSDNARVQQEFDNNAQELDINDPKLSYFRTYYLGAVQNVTFLHYEKTTKGTLTDFGYHSNIGLSHGAAIRLNKSMYLAGTLAYMQGFFDKHEALYKPYQTERVYKAGISLEYYPVDKIALRAVSDVASYFQMRDKEMHELERRDLQQTLAMSYFYSRDIVISPKLSFNVEDIRPEKTNIGMSLNLNL